MKSPTYLITLVLVLLGMVSFASAQDELRPNDSIQLIARGMPDTEISVLNGVYNIDGNGNLLGLPYMKDITVSAAGLTPAQLAQRISAAYIQQQIYTTAQFTVSTNAEGRQIERSLTLGGEVRAPSQVPWSYGMNLQTAIAQAGGPSDFASWKVLIYRDSGEVFEADTRTPEGAQFEVEPRDYIEVWQEGTFRPIRP